MSTSDHGNSLGLRLFVVKPGRYWSLERRFRRPKNDRRPREPEQELLAMTAVGEMPDVAWQVMAAGAWDCRLPSCGLSGQKALLQAPKMIPVQLA